MLYSLLIAYSAIVCASPSPVEQETFSVVISEENLPCSNLQKFLDDGDAARRELTNEEREQMFRLRGGVFRADYMARNEEEAMLNFKAPHLTADEPKSLGQVKDMLKVKVGGQNGTAYVSALTASESDSANSTANQDQAFSPGYRTVVEFCLSRGTPMNHEGQYLRMCTVCSTVTHTPPTVWPPLLYGAMCDLKDNECLYENHKANGKCFQEEMLMDVLVQSGDRCLLLLKNGQKVLTQDWTLQQHPVGIGCICAVNKNSSFR